MIFHVPKLREIVRSAFNQSAEVGHLSTTDIDFALNEAYMSRCIDLVLAHEGYFEEVHNFALVADQDTYDLPKNFNADEKEFIKAVSVERKVGGRWIPLDFRRKYNEAQTTSHGSGDGYLPTYKFRGRQLVLDPPPASAEDSANTRIIYAAQPARLISGLVASGASTTTPETIIRLGSNADPRDDYYNGARVMVTSGISQCLGETRLITDYDGRTKQATVAVWVDHDSDPATVNPKENDTYSILISDQFPEIVHELIALDACMSGYLRERTSSMQMSDFATHRRDQLAAKFMSLVENRTDQRKFTQPFHPEFE